MVPTESAPKYRIDLIDSTAAGIGSTSCSTRKISGLMKIDIAPFDAGTPTNIRIATAGTTASIPNSRVRTVANIATQKIARTPMPNSCRKCPSTRR